MQQVNVKHPLSFYRDSRVRRSLLRGGALSCQPGDILRFEPDAEREPASNKENFK
jgi:hypothetical protein